MHELIDFLFHIANVTANLLHILSLLVATPSEKKNPILGLNLDSGFFLTEGVYVK